MKGMVSLADFPKEGMSISGDIPLESAAFPEDIVASVEGISLDMRITKVEKSFRLHGKLNWKLNLLCGRCLDPFPSSGSVDIRHGLQHPVQDPDPDTFTYAGEEFDLHGMVRELVELNLPMKPLCSEDCRGLCPACGKNLNRETCACAPAVPDARWEALEKLKTGV